MRATLECSHMLSAEEGASESAEAINEQSRSEVSRPSWQAISTLDLGESQHAIGTQFERSSDKCLVVISQRCRSPRTASDSSSSCRHMSCPILGDYSPPGHQRPSEAIRGHQRPSAAISDHQRPSGAHLMREVIRGHQRPSATISDHQRPSGAHLQAEQVTIHPLAHQSIPRDAAVVVDRLTHGSRALGQARMSVSEGGHEGGGVVGRRPNGLRT